MNKVKSDTPSEKIEEIIIQRLLKNEALKLPSIDLLSNILVWVRREAKKLPSGDGRLKQLLRLSVLYGLDGVLADVLRERYGEINDIDINTVLPLDDSPIVNRGGLMRDNGKMYMPAYAMASILGHENIVAASLALGGTMDTSFGFQWNQSEEVHIANDHTLPSQVFLWIFMKNMPGMIRCLVNQGFQFRWIEERHLDMMQSRLFEASHYESNPNWTDLDQDELMHTGGSRERCQLRASAAYKKQMEMLDLLISLGFPFSLFFGDVTEVMDREQGLLEDKKLETEAQAQAYMRSLSNAQRKAREKLYYFCSGYNSIQTSEPNTLTLQDFFEKLKARWDGQQAVQVDRLPEFEALDDRWRKANDREERNDDDGDE